MATRIKEALDYINGSEDRYEIGIVGGSLLFVGEYVFVFSGRAAVTGFVEGLSRTFGVLDVPGLLRAIDALVLAVGVASLAIATGYLLEVVTAVSEGRESPPTFLPFTWRSWGGFAVAGSKGMAMLVASAALIVYTAQLSVAILFALTPPVSAGTVWVIYLFDLVSILAIFVLVFCVPYVLLAMFLLVGTGRSVGEIGQIGRNREYLSSWIPLIVLLVFNSDVTSFVYDFVVNRRVEVPEAGSDSMIAAFLTFWLLVSIAYLFADALSDGDGDGRSAGG